MDNPINPTVLLAVAGIFLFLGILLGLIFYRAVNSTWRRQRYKPEQNELLRIIRKKSTQNIYLEFRGKIYQAVDQMRVDHYRELLQLISALRKWAGVNTIPEKPFVHHNLDTKSSNRETPSKDLATGHIVNLVENQTLDQKSVRELTNEAFSSSQDTLIDDSEINDGIGELEGKQQAGSFIQSLVETLRGERVTSSEDDTSLVGQINTIFQKKIERSPYRNSNIAIQSGPDHELIVSIDDQKYTSIENVPDADLRNLIIDSVAEWEKQLDERTS